MRRFFQTFVLAPLSPTNYYVRTDIFRYQDEIFNDEEVERVEEINEKLDNQRTNRYNNNNNKNNNNSESTETGIKNNIGQVVSSFDALNVNVDMNGVSDIERGLENDSETLEKKNTDSSLLNNNNNVNSNGNNSLYRPGLKGTYPINFGFKPIRPFSMPSFEPQDTPMFDDYIDPRFRFTIPFPDTLQLNSALETSVNNQTLNENVASKKSSPPINREKIDFPNEPMDEGYMYDMMNENIDKYYIQDPFVIKSKSRSRGPSKSDKPMRTQDFHDNEFYQEDYEPVDSYNEMRALPQIFKSASNYPKYSGPAPYRLPHYQSYYPTQYFPSPYEPPMPSKSSSSLNSWSGLAGFLLGILPLGILMASMVPAFVSVPVTTAAAGIGKRKKRSLDQNNSNINNIYQIVSKYEWTELMEPKCLNEITCQIMASSPKKMATELFEAILSE